MGQIDDAVSQGRDGAPGRTVDGPVRRGSYGAVRRDAADAAYREELFGPAAVVSGSRTPMRPSIWPTEAVGLGGAVLLQRRGPGHGRRRPARNVGMVWIERPRRRPELPFGGRARCRPRGSAAWHRRVRQQEAHPHQARRAASSWMTDWHGGLCRDFLAESLRRPPASRRCRHRLVVVRIAGIPEESAYVSNGLAGWLTA